MKTRRLPETDLARLASLNDMDALEKRLRAYENKGGGWSYEPVRQSTGDLLGSRTPLLGTFGPVSWTKLAQQVRRACNHDKEQVDSNLKVGKALYDAANQKGWKTAEFEMGRLPIGFGESVRYWDDVVVEDDQGLFIPFFDYRLSNGISNSETRQIVYSMQHTWVRERNPDLMDARLAVISLPRLGSDRVLKVDFHHEAELLSYEELTARVRRVYETWARISWEKANERRRTGTGGSNPLGF